MNLSKDDSLKAAMDRVVEDNKRIAEKNLKKAKEKGVPVIDPSVSKRYLSAIKMIAGKRD